MAGGGSGTTGYSSSSFGAQGTGAVWASGAADLLKQFEQLMEMANKDSYHKKKIKEFS